MDLTAKEFELLLCEFCRQDLPPSFTVEHDIKIIGNESENKRQIDTKIKGRLGISEILICGEAKYWNEPVGSDTIDAVVGKYMSGEIRANKVILFSNKGYTAPAINRAKLLGIELLEPQEIGIPIKSIPHIVGLGYIGQMEISIVGAGPQYLELVVNPDEYVIIKGDEKISFQQNVFRIAVSKMREVADKNIFMDLPQLTISDKNVLYELKYKPDFRYNVNFEVNVSIQWDYFCENLPTGVLRHLNTDSNRLVNLQGSSADVINKILLSPTKINYEQKEDCIQHIIESRWHCLHLCMTDPDRNKSNPEYPILLCL